jgi:hypothetical protein
MTDEESDRLFDVIRTFGGGKRIRRHWYKYRLRGFSPDCQPDDFVSYDV